MKKLLLFIVLLFTVSSYGLNIPSLSSTNNHEKLSRFLSAGLSDLKENPNKIYDRHLSGIGWGSQGNWRLTVTAITSNWVVTTYHARPLAGNVLKFADIDGNLVEREIDYSIRPPSLRIRNLSGKFTYVPQADLCFTKLKEPLPKTVYPILFPNSFPTNGQNIYVYGFLQTSQNFGVVPTKIKEVYWNGGLRVAYSDPYFPSLIAGDSNTPILTEKGEILGVASNGANVPKDGGLAMTTFYPEMKKWIEDNTEKLPFNFQLEIVEGVVLYQEQVLPIENTIEPSPTKKSWLKRIRNKIRLFK